MVGAIQEHLEAIYGFECEIRAEAFLVDENAARLLGGTCRSQEELLVLEGEDELELALYLHPELIESVAASQKNLPEVPWENLDGYCQVAEGVSHFVYLVRAAEAGRRVSLLELEAQAEVDKFASCLFRRWGSGTEVLWARELLTRLFDRVCYRTTLNGEERVRYEEANRLSRNYCKSLLPQVESRRMDRLLSSLRHMYRLGAHAKLRHFAEAC